MRLIRNILIVLLSLVVIVACAWLPFLDGIRLDRQTQNIIEFADVNAIQLDLTDGKEVPQSGLNILAKMAIICNGNVLEINQTQNDSPLEFSTNPYEQFCAALMPYLDGLLIDPVIIENTTHLETNLCLFNSDTLQEQSFLAWYFKLKTDSDPNLVLQGWLDDETGRILALSYYHSPNESTDMEALVKSQQTAFDIYFDGLGLSEEEQASIMVTPPEVDPTNSSMPDRAVTYMSYSDAVYGDVFLELSYSHSGFYVELILRKYQ